MFRIQVNRNLLPMKINYFLYYSCIGPIIGFLPTIARQLGYSKTTYGTVMTVVSLTVMIVAPTTGIIVDKFRVKKTLFLTAILLMGVISYFIIFVPKVPLDAIVELECDTETVFVVDTKNVIYQQKEFNQTSFIEKNNDELITCKLYPQNMNLVNHETYSLNNISNFCDWMSINNTIEDNNCNQINVTLNLKDTEYFGSSYVFHVLSININGIKTPSTACQRPLKTFCSIDCSNKAIMDVATIKTYRGNVLNLYQFWIFFIIVLLYISIMMMINMLQNPICLDLLEDKTEDFGKQKLWASTGWGFFSIFSGWLVDICSVNKTDKNYSPIFNSCLILTICNLFVTSKIKVIETKNSTSQWKSVRELFTKHYVIVFLIWSFLTTVFHTIVTHYLFWYMDDLVAENHNQDQRTWIKTLQGLTQGIQCFGGEIPFFFWSGWIIRKMGHINCMALSVGAMAIRMYLYTVIWNPAWVILIELLNGVSYALAVAVKMSYIKNVSPPGTCNTVIGFVGLFDCIGDSLGSLVGGYLFDLYGGVWTFRFFAYSCALTCFLNILSNKFGLTKNLKNYDFTAVPIKINDTENTAIEN